MRKVWFAIVTPAVLSGAFVVDIPAQRLPTSP